MKRKWLPYHWQIPLTEGEVPMDKGGFRAVTAKGQESFSALEAVVYCKDCIKQKTDECPVDGWMPTKAKGDFFCADGEKGDRDERALQNDGGSSHKIL